MKSTEPVIVSRKINAAKRRAAGRRIAANIRRLQRIRRTRTAGQALAEARGQRLAGKRGAKGQKGTHTFSMEKVEKVCVPF